MTPENVRYHAAGHLAAAAMVAQTYPKAAQMILDDVLKYVNHPMVNAPPQVKEKVEACASVPATHVKDIILLETWFVDPLNTTIEKSGGF